MISLTDILDAISDDKSLMLFNTIAVSYPENDTEMILVKLKLTKKQYYSRMYKLVKANLINRRNGKYFLTSLGKIAFNAQTIIAKALHDYWRLKAIDELESAEEDMPKEEYHTIIDLLINNEKIREGLIHKSLTSPLKN
jgi:hypothetical protein